nr:MAG TPA: hypothetical protein [Caudoviricetes sp.]
MVYTLLCAVVVFPTPPFWFIMDITCINITPLNICGLYIYYTL